MTQTPAQYPETALCANLDRQDGRLRFAGQDTLALARQYGTPLYLMDEGRIRRNCRMYTETFRACFGTDFPGIDVEAHDIKHIGDGYYVLNSRRGWVYNVDMLEAYAEGDEIVIKGDRMSNEFGSPISTFEGHAVIRLVRNPESPYGFTVKYYAVSL